MKNFFKFLLNQVIIQIVLYVVITFLIFFFIPEDLPINMLKWTFEGKFAYVSFSLLSFILNWIYIYDNDDKKSDIKCSCPYCEKTFKIDLEEKFCVSISNKNITPIYTGIAIGTILASS